MATSAYNNLGKGIANLGDLIRSIVNNDMAMYFITLLLFSLMITSMLKSILKKVPIFEGSDDSVNSSGNIVAWCISLLTTSYIGWSMRSKGPGFVVETIAGPFGIYILVVGMILMGFGIYKSLDSWSHHIRVGFALVVPSLIGSWILGQISKTRSSSEPWFWTIVAILIVLLLILLLSKLWNRR